MEEAATPFPSEETTPPVTKIYFGAILIARVSAPGLSALHRIDVQRIMAATGDSVKSNSSVFKDDFSYFARCETFFQGTCLQEAGNTLLTPVVLGRVAAQEKSGFKG